MSEAAVEPGDSARFMDEAIRRFFGAGDGAAVRVLDFGCGAGELVRDLRALGYDVRGCDIEAYWPDDDGAGLFSRIGWDPYRLPYDDESFDVVVSTSVLEHAQNSRTVFEEIKRVLVPGGCAIHLFPAKWYLPAEPHIFVPLVNFTWPRCPRWWLALWAILGVRNEFQRGLHWREVVERNHVFCRDGVNYVSSAVYRKLSQDVFGNHEFPGEFLIEHGFGGFARLARRLPAPRALTAAISRECRMTLLVQRKTLDGVGSGAGRAGARPAALASAAVERSADRPI